MGRSQILSLFVDHDRSRFYCKYKEKSLQDFKQGKCFNRSLITLLITIVIILHLKNTLWFLSAALPRGGSQSTHQLLEVFSQTWVPTSVGSTEYGLKPSSTICKASDFFPHHSAICHLQPLFILPKFKSVPINTASPQKLPPDVPLCFCLILEHIRINPKHRRHLKRLSLIHI